MSVDETPADVMPIAVLIDELKHEDVHIRLTATRQLSTIGQLHPNKSGPPFACRQSVTLLTGRHQVAELLVDAWTTLSCPACKPPPLQLLHWDPSALATS